MKKNQKIKIIQSIKKANNLIKLKETIERLNLRKNPKVESNHTLHSINETSKSNEKSVQNLLTAAFRNPISRIPTENAHLDERIEIDELEKSSFSERYYLDSVSVEKPIEKKEELYIEKMNEAANIIQKIWKGYKTRQLIEDYLNFLLQEKEEENFLDYYQEEIVNHSANIEIESHNILNPNMEENYKESQNSEFKKQQNEDINIEEDFFDSDINHKKLFYEDRVSFESNQENNHNNDESIYTDKEKPLIHSSTGEEILVYKGSNDNSPYLMIQKKTSSYQEEKPTEDKLKINKESSNNNGFKMRINDDFLDSNIDKNFLKEKTKILNEQEPLQQKKSLSSEKEVIKEDIHFIQKPPHETSNEKNISNILHYREINDNSKSLITVKDFEGDYSDLLEKDEYKISKNNFSADLFHSTTAKAKAAIKNKNKSSTEFLRDQLMDNLKNLEEMVNNSDQINKTSFKFDNTSYINNQNNVDNTSYHSCNYEKSPLKEKEGVKNIQEIQANLWYEMIENLKKIQESSEMNDFMKSQLLQLQRISEMNIFALKSEEKPNSIKKPISSHLFKKKPTLQINIEDDNTMINERSDNNKSSISEQNHSSLYLEGSLPTNFPLKQFVTPIFTSPKEAPKVFINNNIKSNNSEPEEIKSIETTTKSKAIEKIFEDKFDKNCSEKKNDENGNEIENKSIFSLDPFQEFAMKFKSERKKPLNLLEIREQIIEKRQETEISHMKKLLDARKVSPKSFENRKIELEKWVLNEKNEILKTKNELKQSWIRTTDTIQKTRRDIAFMKKIGGDSIEKIWDFNMKFSFSQDDLLAKSNFLLKPELNINLKEVSQKKDTHFLNKSSENKPSFFEASKIKMPEKKDVLKDLKEDTPVKIENQQEENEIKDLEVEENLIENENELNEEFQIQENYCDKFMESKDEPNNAENNIENDKISIEKYPDAEISEKNEKNCSSDRNDSENKQGIISREEMFEEFKESDIDSKRLQSEGISQREKMSSQTEEIKLDYFMDYQDLEDELNSKKDKDDGNQISEEFMKEDSENIIFSEEISLENSKSILGKKENISEIQSGYERRSIISDQILEELLTEFYENRLVSSHYESWVSLLSKKNYSINHHKEFDSHFPNKANEDFTLIKSQELRIFYNF